MSSVLFIKGADFSANAIGKINLTKMVFSETGSAQDGTVSTGSGSTQSRFWLPFVPTSGKKYKAVLSVTNGSTGSPSVYSDICAVRFVAGSTDKLGQNLIIGNVENIPDPDEYVIEGEATCDGTYGYIYLVIQWALEYPTKYPNFNLEIYDVID